MINRPESKPPNCLAAGLLVLNGVPDLSEESGIWLRYLVFVCWGVYRNEVQIGPSVDDRFAMQKFAASSQRILKKSEAQRVVVRGPKTPRPYLVTREWLTLQLCAVGLHDATEEGFIEQREAKIGPASPNHTRTYWYMSARVGDT